MTTETTARVPVLHPAMTLAGLIEQCRVGPDLSPRRRRGALARASIAVAPGRCRKPRSPAWAALVGQLDDFRARHRLARLAGHCSLAGIEPAQVTDAVMDRFLDALQAQAIKGDPH